MISKQVKVALHMDSNLQAFSGQIPGCSAPFPVNIHLDAPTSLTPFSRTAFSLLLAVPHRTSQHRGDTHPLLCLESHSPQNSRLAFTDCQTVGRLH